MSYSYYLLHGVTLKAAVIVVAVLTPPATSHWLMLFIALPPLFLATLLTSGVLFLAVERPWSLRSGVAAKQKRQTAEAGSLLPNTNLQ
jgi:peptidoglycan/LPS O-acetylase OafA/YrhL